jgi:tRNA G46 methylase TrmB
MKPARKILPHNFWSIYRNNMNLIQVITQTIIGRWKPSKPRVMLDSPKIEISNLFAQKAPLIVEIGVGKGLFIRKYAQQTPEMNFLGY